MRRASILLLPLVLSGVALAQDASSWSSGSSIPNPRGGDTKLLRTETPRKAQRPPTAVTAPADAAVSQRLIPPGSATPQGTGALASSTVPKSTGGNDAAYDAFDQGRYLTALELAQAAAAKGDPQAHTLIARLYQEGLGVPVDLVGAAQWYRRAAELGDIEGTFAFAVMLAEGDGIQKNRVGAADLFETAAARGHVLANYNLGLLFLKGDGKPENPRRAALHLRYAAERGIAQAQFDLATLYATGTGVEADASEAAGWMERAADQGHTDALLEFGVWLFQGRGVAPSQSRGALLFKAAAEKGNVVAQNRLARSYAFGAGLPADVDQAAKWHLVAKAAGVADTVLDELVGKMTREKRIAAQRAADAWREEALLR